MEIKTYPLGITQDMVDEWKRLYKGVSIITVTKKATDTSEEKVYNGFFRRPDLKILSAAGSFADSDPIKSGSVMFDNCKLKLDPEMESDDEIKMTAITKLNGIFKLHEAEVKNL